MAFGNIGRAIAGQAIENTKKNVMDALLTPEAPKPGEKPVAAGAHAAPEIGPVILGQIQAMQRPLRDDQELQVWITANGEQLRVLEIFVPSPQVLVFAGIDSHQNVTRIIVPVASVPVVCKIVAVADGVQPVRVNVLTPRPPKPESQPSA